MCNLVVFILVKYSSLNATPTIAVAFQKHLFLLDLDGVVCQKHLFRTCHCKLFLGFLKVSA